MLLVAMMETMSEKDFERLADETLRKILDALADTEEESLDVDLESGVLTLRFDDGVRYVVNSHRAARQIWMAAEASAWHFEWNGDAWRSTKSDEELWSLLEARVSKKLGRSVQLPH